MKKRFSLLITTVLLGCSAQKSKVTPTKPMSEQVLAQLQNRKNSLKTKLYFIRKKINSLEKRIAKSELVSMSDLIGSYHGREATSINQFLMSHYEKEILKLNDTKKLLESELSLLSL